MKDVEKMVEADPDAAKEKLKRIEEEAILERATLKVGLHSICSILLVPSILFSFVFSTAEEASGLVTSNVTRPRTPIYVN